MDLQKMKTQEKDPASAGCISESLARGDDVPKDSAPGNCAAEDPASEGCFTGIGVGPGDPELLTLKAIRCIRACDYLAMPVHISGIDEPVMAAEPVCSGDEEASLYEEALRTCVSCRIVSKTFALLGDDTLQGKPKILLPAPMCRDQVLLQKTHDRNAAFLSSVLKEGKNIAYITLGDPGIYSTCMFLFARLQENGHKTQLIPGVPSFCAAAAKAGISLAEDQEEIHIFPAPSVREEELNLPGTKILMKAGRQMPQVKRELLQTKAKAVMVENCGMENERICLSAEKIPDSAGYYAIVIVK